jgi:hypothetical protein
LPETKTKAPALADSPVITILLYLVGCSSLVIGLPVAFNAERPVWMLYVLLSSLLWFSLGFALHRLDRIARNTRPVE